jgi:hypothetical protein
MGPAFRAKAANWQGHRTDPEPEAALAGYQWLKTEDSSKDRAL